MRCAWRRILPAAVLGFVLVDAPALADSCKPLTRIASLDTTDLPDGRITASATMDGKPFPMLIDTGSPVSSIDDQFSQSLGLGRYKMFDDVFYLAGEPVRYTAMVRDMTLGGVRVEATQLLINPRPLSRDGSIAGLLGDDILGHYDVEFDFVGHKLDLFRTDHCPGVIYWPAAAVGVVPFRVARGGYVVVDITLDGKPVRAIVDTGATDTLMTDVAAEELFGLTASSPEMTKRLGDVYEHRFKALDLGGLAISNVPIFVYRDVSAERIKAAPETGSHISSANIENGLSPLTIGMHELRRLHLYFAFGEGKLYATAPTPPPVAKPTMN